MKFTYILVESDDFNGVYLELKGAKFHHLVHVRRIGIGALLRAALPDGHIITAEVNEVTQDMLRAHKIAEEQIDEASPCRITLFQSVLKGEKMEFVVQKASELGVAVFAPLLARRSIPRWTETQVIERAERWQRIADSSAEQCERNIPLLVEIPRFLPDILSGEIGTSFVLHERNGKSLRELAGQFKKLPSAGLFVGPEGGWEKSEAKALMDEGVIPVNLGSRILRAETASLVAVTLTQFIWGDLGRSSFEGE